MRLILSWRKYCDTDFKDTIRAIIGNMRVGLTVPSALKMPRLDIFVGFTSELIN